MPASSIASSRVPFTDLMELENVPNISSVNDSDDVLSHFMGKHTSPSLGGGGGYGGFVYAQSVWAAAQTVAEGLTVHNVHGYFTLPAYTDRPLFYSVQTLSSGRSFSTRLIKARQPLEPCTFPFDATSCGKNLGKVCFVSMCSFKKVEIAPTKHQPKANLKTKYKSVLKANPDEYDIAPKIDTPWWRSFAKSNPAIFPNDFPGLDIRKVNMATYNEGMPPEEWKQLSYYRPIGHIPAELPNLHSCAHLFASDRNSLFLISNAVGFADEVGSMGSLSHSVVFHVNGQDLLLKEDEWWCQEAWTSRSEGGRGMHESYIWNPEEALIASTWQEGLVRKAENGNAQRDRAAWMKAMKRMSKIDDRHATNVDSSKL